MPRLTKGLSARTKENQIKRLEKHVKRFTVLRPTTEQVNGKLTTTDKLKYVGCRDALTKLNRLKSV